MTRNEAKKPAKKKAMPKSEDPLAAMAELIKVLHRADSGGEPLMKADLDALLKSWQGPSAQAGLSDEEADAKDRAQENAFDAMKAESEAEARKLAKRALRLDPDCVDALMVLTDLDSRSTLQLIDGLKKAVAAGERSLGAKFIGENKGHFWLLLETRPYMRALETLARAHKSARLNVDAIGIYEKMLDLNPNDNQGVRDPLLGLYLETDNLAGAAKLLKKYKEDSLANFAWGRVLERFLAGDRDAAGAALAKARKANPHMELYLTARKPLPKDPPEMYSPGSEEEAVLCLDNLGGAWAEHKEAAHWLFDQLARDGQRPAPSKAALKKIPVAGKKVQ
jgi:tetratricopeptide (TPR) repeat protein